MRKLYFFILNSEMHNDVIEILDLIPQTLRGKFIVDVIRSHYAYEEIISKDENLRKTIKSRISTELINSQSSPEKNLNLNDKRFLNTSEALEIKEEKQDNLNDKEGEYVGIDIGSLYTKISLNDKDFCFKTLVEPYIHTEKVFNDRFSVISVNGNNYLVGSDASPRRKLTEDFVGTEPYFAIIGYCINKLVKQGIAIKGIGLGLPPSVYDSKKISLLKYQLKTLEIKTNGNKIEIPEKIEFLPQGLGAYIDFAWKYSDIARKDTIVIDIGYYTLDMVYIKDGVYISKMSRSYPAGMEILYNKIIDEFTVKYSDFINDVYVDLLLKDGKFTYFGKEYKFDVQEYISRFYLPEIESRLKDYVIELKNNGYKIDQVLLTGGGAVYLNDKVDGVYISDNPQFANARGYKIYVEYVERK